MIQINKIIDRIVEIGILAIIGLVPIYFNPKTFNTWELNTSTLFQTITEIIFAFWLTKIILRKNALVLKNWKFILPALLFIAILGLSTIFSFSPSFSFSGSYERKMGYFAWLHFFLFFIVLIDYLKSFKQFKKILIVSSITSSVVIIYGLLQIIGYDPFGPWSEPAFPSGRVFSTFGQPNFLGAWLLFALSLSLICFLVWQKFILKFLAILLFFGLFLILIFTLSRGAWLGFLGGLLFFSFIFLWSKNKKKAFLSLTVLLILFSSIILYFNLYPPKIITDNPILNRLISFTQLTKRSIRPIWWSISSDLIREKPFLGHGLDTLSLISAQYYQPEFAIYEAINSHPDRFHNEILDVLYNSGIFGLFSWLILIGSTFYWGLTVLNSKSEIRNPKFRFHRESSMASPSGQIQNSNFQNSKFSFKHLNLFRNWKLSARLRERIRTTRRVCCGEIRNLVLIILLSGLFAYLISNQFSFPMIATNLYFFLFLGLIIFSSKRPELTAQQIQEPKQGFRAYIIIFFLFLTVSLTIWRMNLSPVLADYYFVKVIKAQMKSDWENAYTYWEKTLFFKPDYFYHSRLAQALLFSARTHLKEPKEQEKILNMAAEIMAEIPSSKRYLNLKIAEAEILIYQAYYSQNQDYSKAEKAYQDLANFSPKMAGIYNEWTDLYLLKGDYREVIKKSQKALSLYPPLDHPDLNQAHRQQIINEIILAYDKLSQAYFNLKEWDKAIYVYQKILRLDPYQIGYWKKIADVYYMQKKYDLAIEKNLIGCSKSPEDAAWPFAVGLLYDMKGDKKNALIYTQKAFELNPKNENIKNFLEKLRNE